MTITLNAFTITGQDQRSVAVDQPELFDHQIDRDQAGVNSTAPRTSINIGLAPAARGRDNQ